MPRSARTMPASLVVGLSLSATLLLGCSSTECTNICYSHKSTSGFSISCNHANIESNVLELYIKVENHNLDRLRLDFYGLKQDVFGKLVEVGASIENDRAVVVPRSLSSSDYSISLSNESSAVICISLQLNDIGKVKNLIYFDTDVIVSRTVGDSRLTQVRCYISHDYEK
jgi:hypothetical protein